MTEEQMKAMKLHEEVFLNKVICIIRVPNGWIYYYFGNGSKTPVFVPETLPIIQHVEPRK